MGNSRFDHRPQQRLLHTGISQGRNPRRRGFTAVSPDTPVYLGVIAMNLLGAASRGRSTSTITTDPQREMVPTRMSRPLALDLIQMLWDLLRPTATPSRMTDNPLPNTPPHEGSPRHHRPRRPPGDELAGGRDGPTIGASIRTPVVYDGRWPGVDFTWNIPRIQSYPFWTRPMSTTTPGRRLEHRRRRHRRAADREPAQPQRR